MNTLAFLQNLKAPELFILLLWAIIAVVPFWRIFKRIGWPPALSLFAIIPGVIIVIAYLIAFGKWRHQS